MKASAVACLPGPVLAFRQEGWRFFLPLVRFLDVNSLPKRRCRRYHVTIAYNAAGITQLPGTRTIRFCPHQPFWRYFHQLWQPRNLDLHEARPLECSARLSEPPAQRQRMGRSGRFSRFGLGNSYSGDWAGRYNVYDIGVQTISFVPTLAIKLNDTVSFSVGVGSYERPHVHGQQNSDLQQRQKI